MRSSWAATSSFVLLTLIMTWPLAAGLTSDVPGDLGDSLLNMWILGWSAEHLPKLITGAISLDEFRNANIFHPEPLALSFSEHLFGQTLQILPVYHLTGNVILSYNLLFLSSYALSGLGMFLLVRELLGGRGFSWPAFIAGAIYAFLPMRIAQVAHIQSVSSQWMPLALFGFRRFLAGGTSDAPASAALPRRPLNYAALAGGTAALLLQNWSNGYYLVYFTPFAVAFVIHQIVALGRAREWRVWAGVAAAGAIVIAGTLPFLLLYVEGQRVHGIQRPLGEVIRFSADVYSYFSAPEALRLWGRTMQAYPRPEGELFPGVVPLALLAAGVIATARAARTGDRSSAAGRRPAWIGQRVAIALLLLVAVVQTAGLVLILFTGGFITSLWGLPIRATNPSRIAAGIALASVALLAISGGARERVRRFARSPIALALALGVIAMWLSLGPMPQSAGRTLSGIALYGWLYEHVPGLDGLRVPARAAMVAAVFLSIVAGSGAALVLGRVTRPAAAGALLLAALLVDVWFAPMPINQTWGDAHVAPPPRVEPAERAPAVYRTLAAMDEAQVVVEFPFGDPAWELRYVYYSTVHWKRLVNGYSGAFPASYKVRVARLEQVERDPEAAWQTLREAGVTHAVVHSDALSHESVVRLQAWLSANGATLVDDFAGDLLYAIGP